MISEVSKRKTAEILRLTEHLHGDLYEIARIATVQVRVVKSVVMATGDWVFDEQYNRFYKKMKI